MSKQIEALKMAIELMESLIRTPDDEHFKVLNACKKALAEAESESSSQPVAWGMKINGDIVDCICPEEHDKEEGKYTTPLYTHPVTWQSLSDDEIDNIWSMNFEFGFRACARAIEQALKEKNGMG